MLEGIDVTTNVPRRRRNPAPRPPRLYRLVQGSQALAQDFMSDEAKGAPMRPQQRQDIRLYRGISMLSSAAGARDRGRDYPQLGSWIAELDIPQAGYVEVHKTLGPEHYSVIGLPGILRALVRRVEPVS